MARPRRPSSQTWRTFLANHKKDMVSSDFFVVPTVFFRVLFVFVILSHDRRGPVHIAVTEHPTAEWVAHQLLEAFPGDSAPHYLLRDRDRSYGAKFSERGPMARDSGGSYICPIALAERPCRAVDWLDPPGVLGSCNGAQ